MTISEGHISGGLHLLVVAVEPVPKHASELDWYVNGELPMRQKFSLSACHGNKAVS